MRSLIFIALFAFSCTPPPARVSPKALREGAASVDPATLGNGNQTAQQSPSVMSAKPDPASGSEPEPKPAATPAPKPASGPMPAPAPTPKPAQEKPLSENEQLARKFAPILHLHNQEYYLPMDPEEYFAKPQDQRNEDFYLSARKTYNAGRQARTVVNISEDKTLLQYWFFFPKNGCQGSRVMFRLTGPLNIGKIGLKERVLEICNLAIHEGDWENLTLRLNKEKTKIEMVYLSAHGRGNWLPPEAMIMKVDRPYVYAALNSHAFYARDVSFVADTTITHDALNGAIGIEWFQIGDSVTHGSALQRDTSGGQASIDFDSQKALLLWDDFKDKDMAKYGGGWGQPVDGRKILPPPDISVGPIEKILQIAVTAAFQFAPQLKDKSGGGSPNSPWARDDWKNFDCARCDGRTGIGRETLFGSEIGLAFDDFEKVKQQERYKVREIRISAADERLTRLCTKVDGAGDQCHGGSWENEKTLTLEDDEFFNRVDVAFYQKDGNKEVSAMKVSSSKGRSIQSGNWTSDVANLAVPGGTNLQIVGFHGRADDDGVHQLGILLGTKP